MRRPLVYLALAYALGIYLAGTLDLKTLQGFFIAGALAAFSFVAWKRWPRFLPYLIIGCFLALGIFRAGFQLEHGSKLFDDLNTHLYIEGTVVGEPLIYPDHMVYVLRAERIKQNGWSKGIGEKVQLVVKGKENPLPYGTYIEVFGQLDLPATASNPGEYDYREHLARRGIFTRMAVNEPGQIKLLGLNRGNPVMGAVLSLKGRWRDLAVKALPRDQVAVLQAVLFGDSELLDASQVDVFQALGIMHLFAVSGLNVGFVLLFLRQFAQWLQLPRGMTFVLFAMGLLLYAVLSGFSPSVVRAVVMAITLAGGLVLGRSGDAYNSLALAAAVMLTVNPLSLYDVGFQMSFLATWGLIYLYPALNILLSAIHGWLGKFVSVTLAAQLAVLPVSIVNFHFLPLLAVPVNVLLVPPLGVLVIAGLWSFLLVFLLPPLFTPVVVGTGALIEIFQTLFNGIAGLPGATLAVSGPSWAGVLLAYGAMVIGRELVMRREWRVPFFSFVKRGEVVAAALVIMGLWAYLGTRPGALEITFLDVGQGEAIFVRTPLGRTMLVDGGGSPWDDFDVGKRIVVPFLRTKGVKRLDVVASTHPDADHLEGLEAVMAAVPARLLLLPPVKDEEPYMALRELAKERGIPVRVVDRGDRLVLDDHIKVDILHPGPLLSGTQSDLNANSLVIGLSYGERRFMITGDIETAGMKELLAAGGLFKVDLLTLPHHGSKYGFYKQFYQEVDPRMVIVQVGARNNYGHPAPEVVGYWEEQGIPLYRTDHAGAISVFSDGRIINVKTMFPVLHAKESRFFYAR